MDTRPLWAGFEAEAKGLGVTARSIVEHDTVSGQLQSGSQVVQLGSEEIGKNERSHQLLKGKIAMSAREALLPNKYG